MKEPKFDIGDKVYHITPESAQGTVIEAIYSLVNKRWLYTVTFSPDVTSLEYYEHELSDTIQFKK